ncbi:VOC family protein [Streptomyces spinoverrucosus]|uniref:VOC family protein n=1 Tax=Streptomyces spinoverrucosus TaxID=284043 RepID=UPI001E391B31|nr:VOC family protein [Streptomyces spinoverrucosus]
MHHRRVPQAPFAAKAPVRRALAAVPDLTVEDLDAAEAGGPAPGARVPAAEDRSRSRRVYADPAGHPFCLCAC